MHIAWINDIHFNFVKRKDISNFCDSLVQNDPDAVLIGGDISDSHSLIEHLKILEAEIKRPIYFVLGNHDYYRSSIKTIQKEIRKLTKNSSLLNWLPDEGVVKLTAHTCLAGHGCWGDGRFGDFLKSSVMLNDYALIRELTDIDNNNRFDILKGLGDKAAEHFSAVLPHVFKQYKKVIILTHVPPFKEACWHEGKMGNDNWLPHFSCKAAGDVLLDFMKRYPDRKMTILCGHTHSSGVVEILPNLCTKTGGAVYYKPGIQELFTID